MNILIKGMKEICMMAFMTDLLQEVTNQPPAVKQFSLVAHIFTCENHLNVLTG